MESFSVGFRSADKHSLACWVSLLHCYYFPWVLTVLHRKSTRSWSQRTAGQGFFPHTLFLPWKGLSQSLLWCEKKPDGSASSIFGSVTGSLEQSRREDFLRACLEKEGEKKKRKGKGEKRKGLGEGSGGKRREGEGSWMESWIKMIDYALSGIKISGRIYRNGMHAASGKIHFYFSIYV